MYSAVSKTITELSIKLRQTIPGFSLLLHTWGQTLSYHPHLHCILPGGGLYRDHSHFKSFSPSLFQDFIDRLYHKDWVVYAKPVFKCADHVLKYLGNYTHRVAISNQRILSVSDDEIILSYKDNRDQGKKKTLKLDPFEFMRRFLLHVLPYRFMKLRHYGFLANGLRYKRVELCCLLIKKQSGLQVSYSTKPFNVRQALENLIGRDNLVCPHCGSYYSYEGLQVRRE